MLDGSGVKSMPGLISAPNVGSLKKRKKNAGSQMVHTKNKIYLKKFHIKTIATPVSLPIASSENTFAQGHFST